MSEAGSSVARWVDLKFEKPSKIPHFHRFVSFDISIQEPKFAKSELEFPITSVNSSNLGENPLTWQHWLVVPSQNLDGDLFKNAAS